MKFSIFRNGDYITSFKTQKKCEEWIDLGRLSGSGLRGYEIKEEPTYLELVERIKQLEADLEIAGCENCNRNLRSAQ